MKTRIMTLALAALMLCAFLVSCAGNAPAPAESAAPAESTAPAESAPPAESAAPAESTAPEESAAPSNDKIADESEMTVIEDVGDANMLPVYAENMKEGEYPIAVESSSSMFPIEEALLTVSGGKMSVAMTMGGTGYLYVYMGTPEEAVAAPEADYIPYTENAEGKHVFTVEVEKLNAELDCCSFSRNKEKWYARTLVFRADSLPLDSFADGFVKTPETLALADGEYTARVALSGGTGKASVTSPARITVSGGTVTAEIEWSSSNYDYMIVDGEKLTPVNEEGNSTFEVPVKVLNEPFTVIGDTTAMSQPHEIEYKLTVTVSE